VTGCNTGIGKVTAERLAELGADLVLANRSEAKTAPLLEALQNSRKENQKIEFISLDLSDFQSILEFSKVFNQKFDKLNLLINNAGVLSETKQLTKQNHELMFGTNHLGHFLLTNLLIDLIKKTPESRVINVSSKAHERGNSIRLDDLDYNIRPFSMM